MADGAHLVVSLIDLKQFSQPETDQQTIERLNQRYVEIIGLLCELIVADIKELRNR